MKTATNSFPGPFVIVGNGPSLRGSGKGEIIDSFPEIVRFNEFVTAGFEKDVGSKTTVWSRWHGVPAHPCAHSVREIWLNMPVRDRTNENMSTTLSKIAPYEKKAIVIPTDELLNEIEKTMVLPKGFWLSSGIIAVWHCLLLGARVSICGIDSWKTTEEHYYSDKITPNLNHRPDIEQKLIQKWLHDERISRIENV